MIIPYKDIPLETLNNLIEAFVLQEGTDYGEAQFSLQQKTDQVLAQLRKGEAFVQYSELHESVNIVHKEALAALEEQAN